MNTVHPDPERLAYQTALENLYHSVFGRWPTMAQTAHDLASEIERAYHRRVDPRVDRTTIDDDRGERELL